MKHSIILWISALVITIIFGYFQSANSPHYPVSGTTQIEGAKVTYLLPKVYRGNKGCSIWIDSQLKTISGQLQWKKSNDNSNSWNNVTLKDSNQTLTAVIPHQPPLTKIEYRVELNYKNKTYLLPESKIVSIEFLGRVSEQIMILYYFMLFAGILLSVRTGLEIFNNRFRSRVKMYSIFTFSAFFFFTLGASTVKKSYELNAIGNKAVPLESIFTLGSILIFITWIAGMILIFNTKKPKIWGAAASILTLIIFLFGNF